MTNYYKSPTHLLSDPLYQLISLDPLVAI